MSVGDVKGSIDSLNNLKRKMRHEQRVMRDIQHAEMTKRRRLQRESDKAINELKEQNADAVTRLRKFGQQQIEDINHYSQENMKAANRNSQKRMEATAKETAKQIHGLQQRSLAAINDFKKGNMERMAEMVKRSEDPFYKPLTFTTQVQEEPKDFLIQVKLPPHEARNLNVSAYRGKVRLSLNRGYNEQTDLGGGNFNRTNTHQSITEEVSLPQPIEFKNVRREYKDGVLSLRIPKLTAESQVKGMRFGGPLADAGSITVDGKSEADADSSENAPDLEA